MTTTIDRPVGSRRPHALNGQLGLSATSKEYARALEHSPALLDRFARVRTAPELMNLKDEMALARTYLVEVQSVVAQLQQRKGHLDGNDIQLALSAMNQATGIMERCIAVEHKRDDRIAPEELAAALAQLLNRAQARLVDANLPAALPIFTELLAGFKVTTGQRELANRMLDGFETIEVGFRAIRRTAIDGLDASVSGAARGSLEEEEAQIAPVALDSEVLTEAQARRLYGPGGAKKVNSTPQRDAIVASTVPDAAETATIIDEASRDPAVQAEMAKLDKEEADAKVALAAKAERPTSADLDQAAAEGRSFLNGLGLPRSKTEADKP